MTSQRVLAVALTLLGIYLLSLLVSGVPSMVVQVFDLAGGSTQVREYVYWLAPFAFRLLPLGLAGVLLIVFADRLSRALLGRDVALQRPRPEHWVEPTLWIGLSMIGMFLIIDGGFSLLLSIVTRTLRTREESAPTFFRSIVGVYLVFGAPGLRHLILRRMQKGGVLEPPHGPEPVSERNSEAADARQKPGQDTDCTDYGDPTDKNN